MTIDVPSYTENGFACEWEDGFAIQCTIDEFGVRIEANKEGLISLARHLLALAEENVPEYAHFHLDEFNSLNDNSREITVVKRNIT